MIMVFACSPSGGSSPSLTGAPSQLREPESIRTANRLADNEGAEVELVGLAVEIDGRACVHLDRNDAIVPVAGRSSWGERLHSVVRAKGRLTRHADANDPETGLSSLELSGATIEWVEFPDDQRVRTMPALREAEGREVEAEGMAYKSSNGPIVVLYGGLAYVRGLPMWDSETTTRQVLVRGKVERGPLPPDAPPAGGSWAIEASGFERVDP
jgi:hypothetical protein